MTDRHATRKRPLHELMALTEQRCARPALPNIIRIDDDIPDNEADLDRAIAAEEHAATIRRKQDKLRRLRREARGGHRERRTGEPYSDWLNRRWL